MFILLFSVHDFKNAPSVKISNRILLFRWKTAWLQFCVKQLKYISFSSSLLCNFFTKNAPSASSHSEHLLSWAHNTWLNIVVILLWIFDFFNVFSLTVLQNLLTFCFTEEDFPFLLLLCIVDNVKNNLICFGSSCVTFLLISVGFLI